MPLTNAQKQRRFRDRNVIFQPRHAAQRPDWLADDAVSCELVSAPNSVLTGKLTGNFAESGHPPRFPCLINAWIQWLAVEFPTQQNREFQNVDQGIFLEEQGNLNQATASPLELNMLCVIASSQSAPQDVRFTSNGDQIDAAPRTAAMCQLRRNAPQKKALLSPRRQWEASWASP